MSSLGFQAMTFFITLTRVKMGKMLKLTMMQLQLICKVRKLQILHPINYEPLGRAFIYNPRSSKF
jgi:hypothetical protein